MTEERRLELWRNTLRKMPDDLVSSEYHRRLAKRKWAKVGNFKDHSKDSQHYHQSQSEQDDAIAFFQRQRGQA